jgi:hypothetical protein
MLRLSLPELTVCDWTTHFRRCAITIVHIDAVGRRNINLSTRLAE